MAQGKKVRLIKVSEENYQRLVELGSKKDTFDDIVGRLLG